jgi:hypothetical protein
MKSMVILAFAKVVLTMPPFSLLRPGAPIPGNVSQDEWYHGRSYSQQSLAEIEMMRYMI